VLKLLAILCSSGHYINCLVLLAFVLLGIVSGGTNVKARQGLVELSQAIDGIKGMRLAVLSISVGHVLFSLKIETSSSVP